MGEDGSINGERSSPEPDGRYVHSDARQRVVVSSDALMAYIPELDRTTYNPQLHEGIDARSVGWLGEEVPHTGVLAPSLLKKLRRLVHKRCYSDHWMGFHSCEICDRMYGHGEISIVHAGVRYVAPALVIHYVEAHHYLPPEPFLEALQHGTPWAPTGAIPGYVRSETEDLKPSLFERMTRWIRR